MVRELLVDASMTWVANGVQVLLLFAIVMVIVEIVMSSFSVALMAPGAQLAGSNALSPDLNASHLLPPILTTPASRYRDLDIGRAGVPCCNNPTSSHPLRAAAQPLPPHTYATGCSIGDMIFGSDLKDRSSADLSRRRPTMVVYRHVETMLALVTRPALFTKTSI